MSERAVEREPLLRRGEGDAAPPTTTGAARETQAAPPSGGGGTGAASARPERVDDVEILDGERRRPPRRRWHGSLLCPLGACSYESIGVCCSASACFPCPVTYPCMWSHTHARLLGLPRTATFSLFLFFVSVPWVGLRMPLFVARAEACAPLDVASGGGGSIPREDVLLCLRVIKADDVAFWVSVGLTAAAFATAGVLRFAARRRHGVEGLGCCPGSARRAAATSTTSKGGGDEEAPSLRSSVPVLAADVLTWLLCPACALCQEARTAAAGGCERGEWNGRGEGRRRTAAGEEGEREALLVLEPPRVPGPFVRGGDEDGGAS